MKNTDTHKRTQRDRNTQTQTETPRATHRNKHNLITHNAEIGKEHREAHASTTENQLRTQKNK